MDLLNKAINSLPQNIHTIVIDGKAASGKTSLADGLAVFLHGNIVHMDDFFLPKELRTEERRAVPGGNVHYERFIQEVLIPLMKGEKFKYRIFNCKIMDYDGETEINPQKPVIIEGAYSLHPEIIKIAQDFYQYKIFMDVEPEIQAERILHRNGEGCLKSYEEMWIPLENKYIEACKIKDQCDLVLP